VARQSKVEKNARALCVELARVTNSRPMQWRMLGSLAQGLKFTDDEMGAAILAAAEREWILVDELAAKGDAPPHSICLTDDGRILSAG
jgi:hypothetical protein